MTLLSIESAGKDVGKTLTSPRRADSRPVGPLSPERPDPFRAANRRFVGEYLPPLAQFKSGESKLEEARLSRADELVYEEDQAALGRVRDRLSSMHQTAIANAPTGGSAAVEAALQMLPTDLPRGAIPSPPQASPEASPGQSPGSPGSGSGSSGSPTGLRSHRRVKANRRTSPRSSGRPSPSPEDQETMPCPLLWGWSPSTGWAAMNHTPTAAAAAGGRRPTTSANATAANEETSASATSFPPLRAPQPLFGVLGDEIPTFPSEISTASQRTNASSSLSQLS